MPISQSTAAHFAQAYDAATTYSRQTRIGQDYKLVFVDDGTLITDEWVRGETARQVEAEEALHAEAAKYFGDQHAPDLPAEAARAVYDYAHTEVYNVGDDMFSQHEPDFWVEVDRAYAGLMGLIALVNEAKA